MIAARLLAAAVACAALCACPLASHAAAPPNVALGRHPRIPSEPHRSPQMLYVTGVTTGGAERGAATPAQLVRDGGALYATHCSSCHGADLHGVAAGATTLSASGTGGPSLARDGGSGVDFYLTTGRMPLAVTGTQAVHTAPHFDPHQIAAIDAYVATRTEVVAIPHVALDPAALQRGRQLFEDNCQSCHGAAAEGATAGYQWIALPLDLATPVQIGEAIRVGPGVMPRWNARQFSDRDVSAIATYVRYTIETPQDYGGSTLAYLGPVAEGFVGAILGTGSLFWIVYFTGTKADGSRLNETSEPRRRPEPDG